LNQTQAIDTVVNQISVESRFTQALAQVFPGFDFVLNDQYLHETSLALQEVASVPGDLCLS
jgi:hypothetical protein